MVIPLKGASLSTQLPIMLHDLLVGGEVLAKIGWNFLLYLPGALILLAVLAVIFNFDYVALWTYKQVVKIATRIIENHERIMKGKSNEYQR